MQATEKESFKAMKKLLIVESPAKIKTISKFLGKEFKVMSTVGHIKDLPKKKLGVTIDDDQKSKIEIEYVVIDNKKKVIADFVKEASTADVIYLAPDPDREGEIIAWHAEQEVQKVADANKIFRITFNEISANAIKNAIDNPSQVDLKKVAAQQARRVLDRIVGYEVSPVLWRKIAKGLSAGRVQSVALRLICDREEQIRNFKAEEYWTIDALLSTEKKTEKISAAVIKVDNQDLKITNEKDAKKLEAQLLKADYAVESIVDKNRSRKPYAPFMTSSLQQAAFNALGFSVKKTMEIAQKLYEGVPLGDESPTALITYMRTDSLRLSDTAISQTRKYVTQNVGEQYLPTSANFYAKKDDNSQDAHEAIRPIDLNKTPEEVTRYLNKDQAALYDLIWRRTVASQMKPAEYAQRQVNISADLKGQKAQLRATGSTLVFDGFLKIYNHSEDEEEKKQSKIPAGLENNQNLNLNNLDTKQHFTQPPARFSEASLVKELEKEGIGRPSTYATILNTIRAREYTTVDKKRFVPTELGMVVTKTLTKNLPTIMDYKFTALMEEDLDKIAHGTAERDTVLKNFYKPFKESLTEFAGLKGKQTEPTDVDCLECKTHKLVIRFGKNGEFLGCSGFPECNFTSQFSRNENNEIVLVESKAQELDEACPKCQKNLREVVGRFGPFIACSGYPECNYIKQEIAEFKCPKCQNNIVKRSSKNGKFWGCSGYPKCRFAIFDETINQSCPDCKLPFMVSKKAKEQNIIKCYEKDCTFNTKTK